MPHLPLLAKEAHRAVGVGADGERDGNSGTSARGLRAPEKQLDSPAFPQILLLSDSEAAILRTGGAKTSSVAPAEGRSNDVATVGECITFDDECPFAAEFVELLGALLLGEVERPDMIHKRL